MAEKTGIAWCDSTFNPWIGCSAVSVARTGGGGCDNCYAKALVEGRMGKDFATRWRTSASYWKQPLRWNKKAAGSGARHLVFCASLADVFDNEVPDEWRSDLLNLIEDTPCLTWLLLTKRIGNAAKMIPEYWPHVGGVRTGVATPWPNVWLGASVVNQMEADRDIPKLLATPAALHFVSQEPGLGPVNWRDPPNDMGEPRFSYLERVDGEGPRIDWVIVGGESAQGGAKARPFDIAWARDTVAQCKAAGVPVFVKQLGSAAFDGTRQSCNPSECMVHGYSYLKLKDRAGADPAEWPDDLRVQEFPA